MSRINRQDLINEIKVNAYNQSLERAIDVIWKIYQKMLIQLADILQKSKIATICQLISQTWSISNNQSKILLNIISGQQKHIQIGVIKKLLHITSKGSPKENLKHLKYLQASQAKIVQVCQVIKNLHQYKLLWDFKSKHQLKYYPFNQDQPEYKIQQTEIKNVVINQLQQKQAIKNGYHKLTFKDGSKYQGYLKNGKLNGQGTLQTSVGNIYQGQWNQGKAQGYGIFTNIVNGSVYQGQWENDLENGYGIMKWIDKSQYQGFFMRGKKNGKGLFKWADGSYYKGDWIQNKQHGFGKLRWSDGRQYQGEWVNGRMNGQGKFIWPDGRYYKGKYINDRKQGIGLLVQGQKQIKGQWKQGILIKKV